MMGSDEGFRLRVSIFSFLYSWICLLLVTFTTLRFSHLLKMGAFTADKGSVRVEGLEALPDGSFALAVNHFGGAGTLRVLAVTLRALAARDAVLADRLVVVTGQRASKGKPASWLKRRLRALVNWGFQRWADNVLRISLDEEKQSIQALRQWKKVAGDRPTLVFPEGKARLRFGELREGSGLWLRNLKVPVVPCAVFWQDGIWTVRFAPPLKWTEDQSLSDVQLGMSIARLLPAPLTPLWNRALGR